ncbi:MAG TPA: winged helix-turn-helix domain-containing protein [Candidatus Polarisedimenticolia bacterium]|jgi:adenylate cyclase|nr:winged helix-turn-helix domain-containing protein [Candidatus Polarisedimenticolia bacterium]
MTVPEPLPRTIRFDVFELDAHAGELRKDGARIKLQDQPLHVLEMLLERRGDVVTRDEMQRRLWPSDTFVDFEHGLYNAIKRVREALGDSAENPRFIETLSKRGYRFIGTIDLSESAPAARVATVESIAVLPFINMSSDREDEYFADGISEEIINALAQIQQLRVVARSSAFSFKGKHVDPRSTGQQLNVTRILEGSVRRAENHLRITAQLIDVQNGYHLWSERYDRDLKDIFEIQDEIARAIAERLKITLSGAGKKPLVKAGTENVDAYKLYAKGRALLYRRGGGIRTAVECFERAVAIDSDYALAWAGLADSYTTLGYYGLARPEASMPKGMEAARRAVALGPSLAEAHNSLAMAALMGAWDLAEAEREFLLAIKLNPTYVQARGWYGLFYLQFAQGRLSEGAEQAKLALASDPLSSYAHAIYGMTCMLAGRRAEGIEISRRAVELDPDSYLARAILQFVLHAGGELEESVAVGESALAMSGRHSWSMATLAVCLADLNKPADADAIYQEMLARGRHQYMPPAMLALAASGAGRADEAIAHAREAYQIRDPHCEFFLSRYFDFPRRLYGDPRFREIVDLMAPWGTALPGRSRQ